VVNQPSRCRDHNLDSGAKLLNLLALGDSAVDDGVLNVGASAELVALLLDLDGKLAGGGKNEDDRSVAGAEVGLFNFFLREERKKERRER